MEQVTPWVFYRDEIDVLEDEMDALFEAFHQKPTSMEAHVLSEQTILEEEAERRRVTEVAHRWAAEAGEDSLRGLLNQSAESPADLFAIQTERPVLYGHVYEYVDQVARGVGELYEQSGKKDEQAFRAFVSLKMIPIKYAMVISDAENTSLSARSHRQKEAILTLAYVDRALGSLSQLSSLSGHPLHEWLAQGQRLKNELLEHFSNLHERGAGAGGFF